MHLTIRLLCSFVHGCSAGLHESLVAWHLHTQQRNSLLEELSKEAQAAHERCLKREAFFAWKAFVPCQKAEREREERLRSMRAQVASWLPDFGE